VTAATAAAPTAGPAPSALHPEWSDLAVRAPRLAATATAHLQQIGLSLSPASVRAADNALRILVADLLAHEPHVTGFTDITRAAIERFKTRLAARTVTRTGKPVSANTIRQRLGTLRTFFDRIGEWDWTDAPARTPIFSIDLPIVDDPLPRFLDDATAARLLRAASADPDPLSGLVVHLLARTGLRVSELCNLTADAVVVMNDASWLRVPLGKLHNDRYVPLHPHLVQLLGDWTAAHDDAGTRCARIANRTVAAEYHSVSDQVDALYADPDLPGRETPAMRRLRDEHRRMLGNGWCTRPADLDCAFETICEGCGFFQTTIEFRPTLQAQRDHAATHDQPQRAALYDKLLNTATA
jgi:integrase